jgi:tRNA pseudouridine55 synthase
MQQTDIGVFAIDKPQNFTSFDVVAKLRGILKIKRIGHGGTLDPMATGVLPIFIGKATKFVDLLEDTSKRYTASIRFGIKTDTGDITGDITEESSVIPDEASLLKVLDSFLGVIEQIPPMYSAVKIGGRPLYDIARSGGNIERKPRSIEIYSLNLISYEIDNKVFTLDIHCSTGTYIRTLAEDIAEKLGTLATLESLRRTKSGPFLETDCISFEEIEERIGISDFSFMAPLDSFFPSLEMISLTDKEYAGFINGIMIPVGSDFLNEAMLKVCYEERMIALAKNVDGKLKSVARFT